MVTYDELNVGYLPSGRLWRGFAPPMSFGPHGTTTIAQSGNPAFGFYDNFHTLHATSLDGPYLRFVSAGCTAEQIADTATEKGLVQLAIDGNAAHDAAILQWGRGLGAPFQLADNDLVFEARLAVSAITAAKWSWAIGLGQVNMGTLQGLFANGGALADANFIGFKKALAAGAAVTATYRAAGQATQSSATKTKLGVGNVAANQYVKLGFRYRAVPRMVEFYVNNQLAGSAAAPAKLTAAELADATFPAKTALLAPIIGIKDVGGDTALNIKVDWMACAQLL
jgi:hypothetical protein